MVRFWLLAAAALALSVDAAAADLSGAPAPVGRWLTANAQAVVQIAPCGDKLCGQIVGIVLAHPGDPMPMDWRGQPQCGETILNTALNPDGDSMHWSGTVLDPRNGDVYQATIGLDENRNLELHGYLGLPIFGQTQTWAPFSGQTLAGCKVVF